METPEILRFFLALVFVVSLMGGLWLILKRLGINGPLIIQPADKRRLKIIEILPIDARRKAILLRRDNTDHLVILGPSGETVIESGIIPPAQPDISDTKP